MNKIARTSGLLLILLSECHVALAQAKYIMAIRNDTLKDVHVKVSASYPNSTSSSCVVLGNNTNFDTSYIIHTKESKYIGFWLNDSCSDQKGSLKISAYGSRLPIKSSNSVDSQQFEFDNHGVFEKKNQNSLYQSTIETFGQAFYYPDPVPNPISEYYLHNTPPTYHAILHIKDAQNLTVSEAVQSGCYTRSAAQNIINQLLPSSGIHFPFTLGSITTTKLTDFVNTVRDGFATTALVGDPNTRVYRAPTIPGEETVLTSGRLISKFTRRLSAASDPQAFLSSNGPNLSLVPAANCPELATALKMLATQSSDTPASQSVSLALDYDTASGFGSTVYAFRLTPNSPVLGLKNCSLSGGGENQLQAPGGTRIHDIYKKVSGNSWQKYDPTTQTWSNSSAPAP